MAEIDDVIVGKTGTLTVSEMSVATFFMQHHHVINSRNNTVRNCNLSPETLQLLIESILFNSTAKVQISDDCGFIAVGKETETALFKFLQDAEYPIQTIIK